MAGRAVVVGGGGIGVASAYYLNRAGWNVTLVDKGGIGRGCSYGNAGLIVPSHSEPIPGPGVIGQALRYMTKSDSPFYVRPRLDAGLLRFFWQFRRYCNAAQAKRAFAALLGLSAGSLDLYEELRREGDADFFFERKGAIEVALTKDGLEQFRHAHDALEAAGFNTKLLSRDDALAIPDLQTEVVYTAVGILVQRAGERAVVGAGRELGRQLAAHRTAVAAPRVDRDAADVEGPVAAGAPEHTAVDRREIVFLEGDHSTGDRTHSPLGS